MMLSAEARAAPVMPSTSVNATLATMLNANDPVMMGGNGLLLAHDHHAFLDRPGCSLDQDASGQYHYNRNRSTKLRPEYGQDERARHGDDHHASQRGPQHHTAATLVVAGKGNTVAGLRGLGQPPGDGGGHCHLHEGYAGDDLCGREIDADLFRVDHG